MACGLHNQIVGVFEASARTIRLLALRAIADPPRPFPKGGIVRHNMCSRAALQLLKSAPIRARQGKLTLAERVALQAIRSQTGTHRPTEQNNAARMAATDAAADTSMDLAYDAGFAEYCEPLRPSQLAVAASAADGILLRSPDRALAATAHTLQARGYQPARRMHVVALPCRR